MWARDDGYWGGHAGGSPFTDSPYFLERAPLPGFLEFRGSNLGYDDWSPKVALGDSLCESTGWVSHTATVCKHSSGLRGTLKAVVSLGMVEGTFSEGYSYALASHRDMILRCRNSPATGSTWIGIKGTNYALAHNSQEHT